MTTGTDEAVGGGPVGSLDRTVVLLVDDDEPWARATGRLLAENRDAFEVELAHDLAAGRERFDDLDPDCVVCDYQLGDGNGLALLETVREADPDRPFILITGRGSETVASDAIGRGVTDYIRKDHDDDRSDLLASRIENAVGTYRTERALERERRSKDAMLDILTATTSKAGVFRQFCTQLVDQRGYACAWIGTADPAGSLVPQATAGRDGYLDDVTLSPTGVVDGEPAAVALERDEPVVAATAGATGRDADGAERAGSGGDGDDGDGWRSMARERGFESAFAAPIRHDGVRFGVLTVYGSTPTIDEGERRALAEYASTIGYAVRTAEWKRSLLADRPVRIAVSIADPGVPLVSLARSAGTDARIEVPSAVDRGDGSTLYIARFPDADAAAIRSAADGNGSVSVVAADADRSPTRCELVVDGQTPESRLADHGGRFERTVVEDDVATVSAHVPDDGTVSTLAAEFEDAYDRADVSTIWTDRSDPGPTARDGPLASLTDRQREVLRHAYHDGYYENPRGVTATELADRFDIARATLTQHLRTAERKVLSDVYES